MWNRHYKKVEFDPKLRSKLEGFFSLRQNILSDAVINSNEDNGLNNYGRYAKFLIDKAELGIWSYEDSGMRIYDYSCSPNLARNRKTEWDESSLAEIFKDIRANSNIFDFESFEMNEDEVQKVWNRLVVVVDKFYEKYVDSEYKNKYKNKYKTELNKIINKDE